MKKKLVKITIILVIVCLTIVSYPIVRLALNDQKVSKALLTDTYYVKITSKEGEYLCLPSTWKAWDGLRILKNRWEQVAFLRKTEIQDIYQITILKQ